MSKDQQVISHNIWNGYDEVVQCRLSVNAIQFPEDPSYIIIQVICDTGYPQGNTVSEFKADYTADALRELVASKKLIEDIRKLYLEAELDAARYYGDVFH